MNGGVDMSGRCTGPRVRGGGFIWGTCVQFRLGEAAISTYSQDVEGDTQDHVSVKCVDVCMDSTSVCAQK